MVKNITLLALFLAWSWSSQAQEINSPAAELSTIPPAQAPVVQTTSPSDKATTPEIKPARKLSYGLSAGTQFSRLYGTTSFLEPSVMLPVTKRFSGYASLTFMHTYGNNPAFLNSEKPGSSFAPYNSQQYILNVGGNYMVNERLNLTGSLWRDLNQNPMPASLNVYNPAGYSGLLLRANYKVTEHLSVSGGFRYSNGNPYQNMWYNPGYPFGF